MSSRKINIENSKSIAIVGMACRFPNHILTPDDLWEFLAKGGDAVIETPPERWNADDFYDPDPEKPNKMYVKQGTFIEDVDLFDADFFKISPREALYADPQQRLLLEVCWEAFENAGITQEQLSGSKSGVYIGINHMDYFQKVKAQHDYDMYSLTGNRLNTAAGRISYTFDLQGPSMALDTACSSSLTALYLSIQALQNHECDLGIVGGVSTMFTPDTTMYMCNAKALSPEGKCKTFDSSADGYVRGEGCAVFILKRLGEAEEAGDRILGVIKSASVNHDGKSAGLTVPNQQAQMTLIKETLEKAKIEPKDVQYIEAHGTATPLGDPIEISALNTIYEGSHQDDDPLYVGCVKTNLGHTEAASGVTSLMKLVLSMQHQKIAPNLHFKQLNPRIDLSKIPIILPNTIMPWKRPRSGKRIGGVSAFGFTGTNAHALVEEYLPKDGVTQSETQTRPGYLLTISAKSAPALNELIEKYITYLNVGEDSLDNIAYTMHVGRNHFRHRVCLVCSSKEEACDKLSRRALIAGRDQTNRFTQVEFSFDEQEASAIHQIDEYTVRFNLSSKENYADLLSKLGEYYVSGASIHWEQYYADTKPEKVVLPNYAFQRKRFWVEGGETLGAKQSDIYDTLYQTNWEPVSRFYSLLPSSGVGFMPDFLKISPVIKSQASKLSDQYFPKNYPEAVSALNRVCLQYIMKAFLTLSFNAEPGLKQNKNDLLESMGIIELYHRLMDRYWDILEEAECIEIDKQTIKVLSAWEPPVVDIGVLTDQFPDIRIELELVRRCGESLDKILVGRQDPLTLLFSEENNISAENLYRDIPAAKTFNNLIAFTIELLLADIPKDKEIRILEIGAGTGGTSAYVFPKLPGNNIHYLFTDVSQTLLDQAKEKFQDHDFISYQVLNIEKDTRQQGVMSHQFDIILASNVLHATQDIKNTMAHVRELLSPNGVIMVYEAVKALPSAHLTFGLVEGWWFFNDEFREYSPLLAPQKWRNLLETLDYHSTDFITNAEFHCETKASRAIVLAKGPETIEATEILDTTQPSWVMIADDHPITRYLLEHMKAYGDLYHWVEPAQTYQKINTHHVKINPESSEDLAQCFEDMLGSETSNVRGFINLTGLLSKEVNISMESLYQYQKRNVSLLLNFSKIWRESKPEKIIPYFSILEGTQGSVILDAPEQPLLAWGGSLWGMMQAIEFESKAFRLNCVSIDLDPESDDKSKALACYSELYSQEDEDQIAHRKGKTFGLRVEHLTPLKNDEVNDFNNEGTFLVTNAFGTFGLLIAGHLIELGVKNLLLMGPTQPTDDVKTEVETLAQSGINIQTYTGDINKETDIKDILDQVSQKIPPLKGIIYINEPIEDRPQSEQSWNGYESVFQSKMQEIWILHTKAQSANLNYFISCSSSVGLFDIGASSTRLSVDAFIAAIIHQRRSQGLPGINIQWGSPALIKQAGGLEAFDVALKQNSAQMFVSSIDWDVRLEEQTKIYPWQRSLTQLVEKKVETPGDKQNYLLDIVAKVEHHDQPTLVKNYIRSIVADILKSDTQSVDERNFFDMGMDSLMTVELRNRLQRAVGETHELSYTLIFDHSNVHKLTDYILNQILATKQATVLETRNKSLRLDELTHKIDLEVKQLTRDELLKKLREELK